MKKLLALLFVCLIGIGSASAQDLRFEGVAGLNISNMGYSYKAGFHAGARMEISLDCVTEGFYANGGALLSLKGYRIDWGFAKNIANAYSLELPVHAGFRYSFNDTFAIFGEAGPYIGIGLFGKDKAKFNISSDDEIDGYSTIEIEYDDNGKTFDSIRRFDFGIGLRTGVEFLQKYSVSFGYDQGLVNLNRYIDRGDETIHFGVMRNINFYFALGYKF